MLSERAIALGIAVTASVALLAYPYVGAPVVPVWDGWTWIAHAMYYAQGGMGTLMRETGLNHGDQVYALPSLIALFAGPALDYSLRPLAFLSAGLVIAAGAVFYRLARDSGLGPLEGLAVFLSVSSYRHFENLLLGFQLGLVLCAFTGVLAIIAAGEWRGTRGLVAAVLLALMSAASSSAGIFAAAVVVLIRGNRPGSRYGGLVAIMVAIALIGAFQYAIARFGLTPRSFLAHLLPQLGPGAIPRLFLDWIRVLGGGVLGGKAATIAGLVVAAGAGVVVIESIVRERRLVTQAGLAVFSLLATLAVAVARSPIDEPSSRHAIFAAPAVGVCAIRLMRAWRPALRSATGIAAMAIGLAWLQADAMVDAQGHRKAIALWESDTRLYLLALEGGGRLSNDEIGRVNPGPPNFIRRLMEFTRERQWTIFSPRHRQWEIHEELPALAHAGARTMASTVPMQFAGPGYVYNRHSCGHASGCVARLSVDLEANGAATVGIIVRRADGTERSNEFVPARRERGASTQSVRVTVAEGETMEPYVFAYASEVVVAIASFRFVMVKSAPA
jgi:hypothetical protein